MKKSILVVAILILGIRLQGQPDNFTYFNKVFEADTMNMLSQAVRPIEDGYLVIGIYTTLEVKALYIMKLDLNGMLIWFKHIDDDPKVKGIEDGKFVLQVDNNSYVVVYAREKPDGWNETHLVKFTTIGDILWHKVHSTTNGSQTMRHIISASDGGFAMVGAQYIEGDTTRYYVLKTDDEGNFEWDKTYMLDNSSVAFSIQETPWDAGYIIGGYAVNSASGTLNYDAWVIKTNHIGDTLWTRTYGSPTETDCACKVIPLTTLQEYFFEGMPIEYLLSGCMYISGVKYMYLTKLDEFGEIIWEKKYNSLGGYSLSSIQTYPIIVRSNNVLENRSFLGTCLYFSGTEQNRIIKFYFNGTIAWHKAITCNPDASLYIKDMQPTSDGGYVLAGYQYSPSPQKGWVVKIDAQGNTCSPVGCDSTVVVSTAEIGGLPEKTPLSLVQIHPNPVRDGGLLTLTHQLPAEFPVAQFTLYDQSGKAVWEHEFNTWDRTKFLQLPPGLPAGLYFWQVTYMGDVAGSGKIVISG